MNTNTFFKDLKVIELANVLAGPAVGMFFAELGAEVIKIENKLTNGDVTRSWKLPSEDIDSPSSAYYCSVNWNKKSLFIDLNEKEEIQTVYDLIKTADIVISNYKQGDDIKFGMDYETLRKINPKIIYAQITGFGDDNKRTAYDLILQAETGFMSMNGTQESGPLKMPVALIDIIAAHQLKEAILIALIKKLKTGDGSKVSVSLYDSAIASLANQATNWLIAKENPQLLGSLHPNIAPYGEIFTTKDDKKIVLAIGNNKQFKALCLVLELNELNSDELFLDNSVRVKNRILLFETLQLKIKNYSSHNLMNLFIEKDVPAGIIRSISELFDENKNNSLIIKETGITGAKNKRVKTAIFKMN
jgi:crotonobetainyl-CoA:carnitine CoA-transferase CaiB-like acyl-CoA transferase